MGKGATGVNVLKIEKYPSKDNIKSPLGLFSLTFFKFGGILQ